MKMLLNVRRRDRRPRTPAYEPLEPRAMLASHPGIVYDADEQTIAVDPAVQAQMGDVLAYISADYEASAVPGQRYSLPAATPSRESVVWGNGGDVNGVMITAVAEPGQIDLLAAAVTSLGGSLITTYDDQLSAAIPFAAIDELASVPSLRYADVVYEQPTNASSAAGSLATEGDIALLADVARSRFGVDGTGLRIGIISDSFNVLGGYAFDVASGVLPTGIEILKEGLSYSQDDEAAGDSDEGRAMAQLVHAIAPGATLLFASCGDTPEVFADSIEQLTAAGCQIIVDDITEGGVPWFADGIVAQATNAAVRDAGVAYFTSAGNFGRNSYQSDFRAIAGESVADLPAELREIQGILLHDFDPGPGIDVFQQVVIPSGTTKLTFNMQWDQPWGENQSDIDLFIYAADGVTLLERLEGNHQTLANPTIHGSLEIVEGIDTVQLVVANSGGVLPTVVKYVTWHTELEVEYATDSSTIVGHANSATAAAIGAADYFATPPYGQSPATLSSYSSWGGTPILFDVDGSRLASPEVRAQPLFVAPSNSNTSFFGTDINLDGLPNFSGTSAAAPQAAAVAALMQELVPSLTADDVYRILGATAAEMLPGFSFGSGAGLIQAEQALARAAAISVSGTVFEDFDRNGRQTADELPISDATVFLDLNGNGRLDVAPAPGSASAYASFASTGPVHVGIRSEIPNPNTPNDGPLLRPFTATSPVDVTDLPGVVTDVGVLLTLQSDNVIDNYMVGPLFITLISPEGIRVPLRGTTVVVTEPGSVYDPNPLMIDASGEPLSLLVSLTPTPVSDFTPGSGLSQLPQVDLAAVVGSTPNGTWQLEVQSADFDPQRTLTLDSWTLFLKSAEPSVTTDASGSYAFAGLPPSTVAGAFTPRLVVPATRSLTTNDDFAFTLGVGQAVRDVRFGVTIPQPVPRPPLLPVSVLRVSRNAVGPQPVVFSWSDLAGAALAQPTSDRFVVVDAVHGRVEKWDGEAWIDVTRPPANGSPQSMLADLAARVIRPNDTVRWVPPTEGNAGQIAFTVLGWNGLDTSDGTSDVTFESTPA